MLDMLTSNSMITIAAMVSLFRNIFYSRTSLLHFVSPEFWIADNGHTIQVTLEPDRTSLARLSGYDFNSSYIFAEIHFHWGHDDSTGSEHSINNEFYAMEAHLVHYDSKYANFTEAVNSGDSDAVAVVAVLIAEGFETNVNSGFQTIATNIPK